MPGRSGQLALLTSRPPVITRQRCAWSCRAAVDSFGHGHAAPAWTACCSCWVIASRSPCASSASTVIAHHPGGSAGRLPFRVAQQRPPLDTHGCHPANSRSMQDSSPARSPRAPVTVPAWRECPGHSPGSRSRLLRTGRVKGVRTPSVVSLRILGGVELGTASEALLAVPALGGCRMLQMIGDRLADQFVGLRAVDG
jgi:hypothetical protein